MGKYLIHETQFNKLFLRLSRSKLFCRSHFLAKLQLIQGIAARYQRQGPFGYWSNMHPNYKTQEILEDNASRLMRDVFTAVSMLEYELFCPEFYPTIRHVCPVSDEIDGAFYRIKHANVCDDALGVQAVRTMFYKQGTDPFPMIADCLSTWAMGFDFAISLIEQGAYVEPIRFVAAPSNYQQGLLRVLPLRTFYIPAWPQTSVGWTAYPTIHGEVLNYEGEPEYNAVYYKHAEGPGRKECMLFRRMDPTRQMLIKSGPYNWLRRCIHDEVSLNKIPSLVFGDAHTNESLDLGLDFGGRSAKVAAKFHNYRNREVLGV